MFPRKPPKGVPRDEWLLAIGMANARELRHLNSRHGLIHRVAAWIKDAPLTIDFIGTWHRGADSDELAAMYGAKDVTKHPVYAGWNESDYGNPDGYAAGAALALALEDLQTGDSALIAYARAAKETFAQLRCLRQQWSIAQIEHQISRRL